MLRVADSRITNRTRLVGFFIVDGDCLRRLVRIILVKCKVGKNVIKIFLDKSYYIDKISSPFADDVCSFREALRYLYPASECSRTTSIYYGGQVSSTDFRWSM